MSIRNLEFFFSARSVALVGASEQSPGVGATLLANLTNGKFRGSVHPVNPKHAQLGGLACVANVSQLEHAPDLAVVCTPPATVPGIIGELGRGGTRAAIVVTAGLGAHRQNDSRSITQAMLDAARPYTLRVLGPNCLGLLVPRIGLNASFAHTDALPGKLAFVSQSGALATAVLDWGKSNAIGFSCFVSLGDSADVDAGDLLDYLANDINTSAILLYLESIKQARKFMSAARAAARAKPVIAVKSGRVSEGAKAAASHTGALAGVDDIVDAALRRAGVLRVATMQDLFDAAETLSRVRGVAGARLMIVTNGGGAGVLATDALIASGGRLALVSEDALARLDALLPGTWSRANPIDIIGDAPAERYAAALQMLGNEVDYDALLLIHAPTAIVPAPVIARACLPVIKTIGKPVLTCWLGGDAVREARRICADENVPTFATPEEAVRAFMQLADYRRNQELLTQTPPSLPEHFSVQSASARVIVNDALAQQRALLTEPEAKHLLAAYAIPVVATRSARSIDDAVERAHEIGFPVALKILSPDISHKTDVGGVALHLDEDAELRAAAEAMLKRVATRAPHARVDGFTVQQMVNTRGKHELIVGAVSDPVFGPVLMFGAGGVAVEVLSDRAFALPPLNRLLARELIERTRIAALLRGYRDRPAVDPAALELTLVKLAQLVCDVPEIEELDVNPLLADEHGVLALDARVRVRMNSAKNAEHLAIRPYPRELEEWIDLAGRRVLLRPIRPEDEPLHGQFLARLAPEDIYFRFFHLLKHWPHAQLARLTQIDYDREMAFIALGHANASNTAEILGVVRAVCDPDNISAEFAVVVRSDLKGKGLGYRLMRKLIAYLEAHGTGEIVGIVLRANQRMLEMARTLGFTQAVSSEQESVEVRLRLPNTH